jgi:hypothetical protein
MKDKINHHFENNENFLLCCFTKKQYESCLKWCHDNNYLSDSDYKDLTDIDIFDRFIYEDLLEQDFKKGGRCVHFNGHHFKDFGSYKIYMKIKECGEEPDLKFYSFADEINEYATIKSSIIYHCSSCGVRLFNTECDRCPHCQVRFMNTE